MAAGSVASGMAVAAAGAALEPLSPELAGAAGAGSLDAPPQATAAMSPAARPTTNSSRAFSNRFNLIYWHSFYLCRACGHRLSDIHVNGWRTIKQSLSARCQPRFTK